jgi:hypothetical protein
VSARTERPPNLRSDRRNVLKAADGGRPRDELERTGIGLEPLPAEVGTLQLCLLGGRSDHAEVDLVLDEGAKQYLGVQRLLFFADHQELLAE